MNRPLVLFHVLASSLLAGVLVAGTPDDPIRPFAQGETVVFLGDSITHNGLYHSYIAAFEATRHPERRVRFVNSGVSGGKTRDALARLEWDLFDHNPGHVFIMLGMNDAGTSHFLSMTGDQLAAENARLLARFEKEMNAIVSSIRARLPGCEIVLCSSSPYDQTGPQERVPSVGKDDAIRSQLPVLRAIAGQFDCRFVDMHTPMSEIDAREKQKDPGFTITSHDRTHPGPVGHMIMAHEILRRLPDTGVVSSLRIDYAGSAAGHLENSNVSGIVRDGATLRFEVLESALPWPADAMPAALALRPAISSLNQQTLAVANLPAGAWTLGIDGRSAGTYDADELVAGIDLAMNPNTPQHAQARRVASIEADRWNAGRRLRAILWVRARVCVPLGVDWNDRAAVLAAVNSWPAHKDYTESHQRYLDAYAADRDNEAAILADIERLATAMYDAAQPAAHSWTLSPADRASTSN